MLQSAGGFTFERTWNSPRGQRKEAATPSAASVTATAAAPFRRKMFVFWDEAGGHCRGVLKNVSVHQKELFASDHYRWDAPPQDESASAEKKSLQTGKEAGMERKKRKERNNNNNRAFKRRRPKAKAEK